jgi:hypothetical protein
VVFRCLQTFFFTAQCFAFIENVIFSSSNNYDPVFLDSNLDFSVSSKIKHSNLAGVTLKVSSTSESKYPGKNHSILQNMSEMFTMIKNFLCQNFALLGGV